ncbi:MAG: NAD(P)H-hydrate epimerase, partial [Opitutales bacterium]
MPLLHPVLTCAAAADWEEALLRGDETTTWAAMRRAGDGVALAALRDFAEIRPLPAAGAFRALVLCGTGHNAGDALLSARRVLGELPDATATVVLVYGRDALRPLALRALEELEHAAGARAVVCAWSAELAGSLAGQSFEICIEGVLGMSMRPPLRAPAPELFALAAGMDIELRAAVDLPAGLGDECAPDGFAADFTYATGIPKAPLFVPANTARTGRVRYIDIGFFDAASPES